MSIIGVLNTLVQADTSAFDKGMQKVGQGVAQVSETARMHSTRFNDSLTAMGQLSGLGGGINSLVAKVTTVASQVKTIVAGTASGFNALALKIIEPFTSTASAIGGIALTVGKTLAAGIIVGLTSIVVSSIPAALGGIVSVGIGAASLLARGWMAAVGPFLSFTFGLLAQAASVIATAVSGAVNAITTTLFGAAANGATFLGGLLANIPTGGLLIVVGLVALILTGVAAVAAAVVGWGALTAIPAAFSAAFAGLGAVIVSLVPAILSTGAAAAGLIATLSAAIATIGLVAGGLLAAGAAAVGFAAKLWSMASAGAESISSISKLARELGIATQAMAALSLASGASAEGFTRSMIHLQRGIEDGSGAVARSLARIRLDPQQLRFMDATQQLRAVTAGFGELVNQNERAAVAMDLFGRAGIEMLDMLDRGVAGLDNAAQRAERFGLTFSASQGAAVRAANREWKGFSLAMEGISRQAAVMFAPLWEEIGKIGGQVGEYLVGQFKTFAEFVKIATPDIKNVFMALFETVQSQVSEWVQTIRSAGAAWGITFSSIADAGLVALAAVVVAFRDLENTWTIVKLTLQIGWLTFLNFIKEPLISTVGAIIGIWNSLPLAWTILTREIGRVWNNFLFELKRDTVESAMILQKALSPVDWSYFSAQALANRDNTGRSTWQRIRDQVRADLVDMNIGQENFDRARALAQQNAAANIGQEIRNNIAAAQEQFRNVNWLQNLDGDLARLGRDLNSALNRAGNSVANISNNWHNAMNQARNNAMDTANDVVRRTSVGLTRAITGHEAALEGGEKAFSLLFGSSSNQNYYQKATMEAVRTGNMDLSAMRRAFEQAPPLRRARI